MVGCGTNATIGCRSPRMFQASLNSDTSIGFGGIADEHDSMSGFERIGTRRLALVVAFVLPAILTPFTSIFATTLTILNVETSGALPGFHSADLPRYIAQQMAEARLANFRFRPMAGGHPRNRVEWSFKLDPYAGGEVRSFVIEGGRQDPDLAAAVAHLTEDLLAHKGCIARSSAYNASFAGDINICSSVRYFLRCFAV
jgi:hypothetical protein